MRVGIFIWPALAMAVLAENNMLEVLRNITSVSQYLSHIESWPTLRVEMLRLYGRSTVIVPTDQAFSAAINASNGTLLTNPDALWLFYLYHTMEGVHYTFNDTCTFIPIGLTSNEGPIFYVEGETPPVEACGSTLYSGLKSKSSIISSVLYNGGVIHVVDRALVVPTLLSEAMSAFNTTSFAGALNATKTSSTADYLFNKTFFVPNNAAFQSAGSDLRNMAPDQLSKVLRYHMVKETLYSFDANKTSHATIDGLILNVTTDKSGAVFVNNARVLIPDILLMNGVMHVIDQVLSPINATNATVTASVLSLAYTTLTNFYDTATAFHASSASGAAMSMSLIDPSTIGTSAVITTPTASATHYSSWSDSHDHGPHLSEDAKTALITVSGLVGLLVFIIVLALIIRRSIEGKKPATASESARPGSLVQLVDVEKKPVMSK